MSRIASINFGNIDHFLYVRISCVCADFGLAWKDFLEHAYFLLVDYIRPDGVTQYDKLQKEYFKYHDYREKSQYAPRNIDCTHSMVVAGIHEEIHEHLACIKEEMGWPWINILRVLLMCLEAEKSGTDWEAWRNDEIMDLIKSEIGRIAPELQALKSVYYEEGQFFIIERTRKAKEYDNR